MIQNNVSWLRNTLSARECKHFAMVMSKWINTRVLFGFCLLEALLVSILGPLYDFYRKSISGIVRCSL